MNVRDILVNPKVYLAKSRVKNKVVNIPAQNNLLRFLSWIYSRKNVTPSELNINTANKT